MTVQQTGWLIIINQTNNCWRFSLILIKNKDMTQIIINLNNKEEETFVETFLKKMKISFEKNEDDFELTDEIRKMIDERLMEDENMYVDAKESLKKVSEKYGI